MRCLYEEKDIPYCPKPINTFERDLFKYFEDKRTRPKRGKSKKKSKKKVSTFLERIKLERKDFQVICIPYLLYLKRLFFYKSL